ncbi:hydrolase of the alpha/beta superfamily [Candidatus Kinetoplastibacterium blastocrithidii TCC012E]|uniref:Hydrolase of the alpha/beta superfamily n=1 Tax=Candidatus Kinetoplastidibacterium blastocrithidiae TCC012E TaxID=1208922 RepID=M1M1G3_9PROT|nr:hydrolase of the alpha/beta superfamily [Candidatus Kinetoplastibacterium blastocrithidii]AFZ83295.1 hydrolase of the alpha/beta superfamily [Candidatus Kinetoplastibacterium blastocrithidii (ex Strigomonas culicis)]AGF50111.1 hydrolase of the alpha/beta superfamily [Candidatus Kinetoplastibacterium blastocrithidii TCC012E]
MGSRFEKICFGGKSRNIDCAIEWPLGEILGLALVLHPHPLYGGSRDNKIVTTVASECSDRGLVSVRPNFRGVGKSDGAFDNAIGETEDMLYLLSQIHLIYPELSKLPIMLAGFSFGSAVAAQVYSSLLHNNKYSLYKSLILIGSAVHRFEFKKVSLPDNSLIIHGEDDEVVPFDELLEWIRPKSLPIVMIPSCTHFFHGRLLILRRIVASYLSINVSSSC